MDWIAGKPPPKKGDYWIFGRATSDWQKDLHVQLAYVYWSPRLHAIVLRLPEDKDGCEHVLHYWNTLANRIVHHQLALNKSTRPQRPE